MDTFETPLIPQKDKFPFKNLPATPETAQLVAMIELVDILGRIDPMMPVKKLRGMIETRKAEQSLGSIKKYEFLREVLSGVPKDQQLIILQGLDRYTQQRPGNIRDNLVSITTNWEEKKKTILVQSNEENLFL